MPAGRIYNATKTKRIRVKKKKPTRYNPRKFYPKSYTRSYAKRYASFSKNMDRYIKRNTETKFFPMYNRQNGPASAGYLQEQPAVSLPTFGLTGSVDTGLSALVLQTGQFLTNSNTAANTALGEDLVVRMGGFTTTRGTDSDQIDGNYCKLKSTLLRININLDPVVQNNGADLDNLDVILPRQFRLIQVKAKRTNSVAIGGASGVESYSGSLGINLWIDELNQEKGLSSQGSVADAFTWLVNKQKWQVLADERFTLYPNVFQKRTSDGSAYSVASGPNGLAKSQRFKNYYLPVPKGKIKYDFDHVSAQPTNFNYIVHTVILCKSMGGSGTPDSRGWNVQATGMTTVLDE